MEDEFGAVCVEYRLSIHGGLMSMSVKRQVLREGAYNMKETTSKLALEDRDARDHTSTVIEGHNLFCRL